MRSHHSQHTNQPVGFLAPLDQWAFCLGWVSEDEIAQPLIDLIVRPGQDVGLAVCHDVLVLQRPGRKGSISPSSPSDGEEEEFLCSLLF